jgi:RNA polymerase sigma-70 factor (ECF subfamily)
MPSDREGPRAEPDLETTASLLMKVRAGDDAARRRLDRRYRPLLRRFAHGRIPLRARDLVDTEDLVQETLVRAFKHIEGFEVRREGAFLAYLRQILVNRVRDEARRAMRRPEHREIPENLVDGGPSPLEEAIGADLLAAYERALARLPHDQREAVVLKIEFGFVGPALAEALGRPSVDAARMFTARSLLRLTELMREEGREE